MKIIIIEGTDRTGKDTLINELKNLSNHTLVIHCSTPEGETVEERNKNQDILFNSYLNNLYNDVYFDVCDLMIFNRAWYGEYVYGTLYRGRPKEDVIKLIELLEYDLMTFNRADNVKTYLDDIYYIQLVNDSYELALKNDDGNSISNDVENIKKETELFKEIFEVSKLKKRMIKVNNGNDFRDKNEILNEVLNFINE